MSRYAQGRDAGAARRCPPLGRITYIYDAAGNRQTKLDARGQLTTYAYDALDRVVTETTANGPTVTLTYDQGSLSKGRLSSLSDGAGLTSWSYDGFGRVGSKTQSLHSRSLAVGYGYAAGGKVNRITYPSGRVVTYGYDTAGRVSSISVDGTALLSGATYEPFGMANGWQWGNGTSHQRLYDKSGRVTAIVVPAETADQQSFGYDLLDRLTSAALAASAVNLGYGYDATGNRTQEVRNGATSQYTMAAASNRLLSMSGATSRTMTYDADGSITSDRGVTFTYDGRERLVGAGATTYYVNGLGQRIEKAGPGANTTSGIRQFVYDEQGHLLGEYDAGTGAPIAEHIYLGDWPVGLMQSGTTYYVHTDNLGAPRTITRSTDNVAMWTWQREPFGAGAIQPPSGFEYNLRFTGQYFDTETNLHYNYFRDYDPSIGRYVQSDPIGLVGGVDTYSYVGGNPLNYRDPLGLESEVVVWQPAGWRSSAFGHVSVNVNGTTYSFGPGGMWTGPTSEYMGRNDFRSGVGTVLGLTPKQEQEFEACLKRPQGSYSTVANNCGAPAQYCLQNMGINLGGYTPLPVNFGNSLLRSGIGQGYNFYPASKPSTGSSAPWAR